MFEFETVLLETSINLMSMFNKLKLMYGFGVKVKCFILNIFPFDLLRVLFQILLRLTNCIILGANNDDKRY